MIIQIKDEAHWHQLRSKHIGASEVSGLANLSPYCTAYSLYHVKNGTAPEPGIDEDATEVGRIMEPAIAELYSRRFNLQFTKVSEYHECDAEPFLGATLDYSFTSYEGRPLAVEIKHVSSWAWRDHGWSPENDYIPPHYEMQIVAQLLATGWQEGRVVAFCDGELYHFTRRRGDKNTEKCAAEILCLVADMKQRLKDKKEPDALGASVDLEVMGFSVRPDLTKSVLDMTHSYEANNLLHDLATWQATERGAKKSIDTAKAKITQMMARASNDGKVSESIVTTHYRMNRKQSEIAEQTITRKSHIRTTYSVKERTDPMPEAIPEINVMAG